MKRISLIVILLFGVGVVAGCAEKKGPAEKAKEAASQTAGDIVERPTERKEASPVMVLDTKKKAAEGKAPSLTATAEKALKPAAVKYTGAGADIYKSKCSPCHGAEGKGTAMAPAFKGNDWVRGATDEEISLVIKNGRDGATKKYPDFALSMPPSRDMPDGDINALVVYIRSLN